MDMNIVLLDANPDGQDAICQPYLDGFEQRLHAAGHQVQRFTLREMDIKYCTGCWTCWWKTPGRCVFTDDMESIYPAVVAADRLVMFSPVSVGFVSSLLKKVKDRMIPLLHPYIEAVQGECHHRKRYDKYPDLALIVKEEADTDSEDLHIIADIFERFALNFRSRLLTCTSVLLCTPEEAADEISRI
jgi:multimeric flavodoxin WrbA